LTTANWPNRFGPTSGANCESSVNANEVSRRDP